ncbi:MAG: SDR family oxidoreductase [Defluviitaleaceae bacterium]|nr:SDR family oxidoreductase [Defluviitaleaceae bacterium]
MNNSTLRLDGHRILITGVSRPLGIGATLAKRLAEAGAEVAVHGYSDYDLTTNHLSAMPKGTEAVAQQLKDAGLKVTALTPSDLGVPGNAEKVIKEGAQKIGNWTPEHIDPILHVNIRASMMMIQSFVAQVDITRSNAITLFTSGQYLSPMVSEMAYCVSKEAIICLCRQGARLLGDKNIRVNCVNPGPNDTGYCFGEAYGEVAKKFPAGRWGTPNDTADLVLFLHSDYGKWITGQIIASDGGVRESW